MTNYEGVLRLYVFNCQISSFGYNDFFYICERTSYSGKVAVAKCLVLFIFLWFLCLAFTSWYQPMKPSNVTQETFSIPSLCYELDSKLN